MSWCSGCLFEAIAKGTWSEVMRAVPDRVVVPIELASPIQATEVCNLPKPISPSEMINSANSLSNK